MREKLAWKRRFLLLISFPTIQRLKIIISDLAGQGELKIATGPLSALGLLFQLFFNIPSLEFTCTRSDRMAFYACLMGAGHSH